MLASRDCDAHQWSILVIFLEKEWHDLSTNYSVKYDLQIMNQNTADQKTSG